MEEKSQSCATLQGINVPNWQPGKRLQKVGFKTAGNFPSTSTHEPEKSRIPPYNLAANILSQVKILDSCRELDDLMNLPPVAD